MSGGGEQIITAWGNDAVNGGRFTFRVKQVGTKDVIRIENKGSGLDGIINVADTGWHHVAVTYNPSLSSNKYKLYVDGMLDVQGNLSQSLNIVSNVGLRMGRRIHTTFTGYFSGKMDEVRVWNVERNQAQIQANKNIEFCSNPIGLVAYYQFNVGIAGGTNTGLTSLPDVVGLNNGTLQTFSLSGSTSNWVAGVPLTSGGSTNSQSISICLGDSLTIGTNVYKNPGIYNDTFSISSTCDSIVATTLAVDTIDNGTTTSGNTITANLTWATFVWVDCGNGNSVISGETNRSFTPTVSGSYAVIIDDGSCIDTSNCITIASMNLKEFKINNINIFPNPALDEISITLKNDLNKKNNISILNVVGKEIITINDFTSGSTINIKNLKTGVYFIKINQNNKIYTKRFVKQ